VLQQQVFRSGRATLQYLIRDGASTDDTGDVVNSFDQSCIDFVSEPDTGMYDALARGLRDASGQVVAYINAGDILFPSAIDVALDVMEQTGSKWLTGYSVKLNESGQVTSVEHPMRYSKSLIDAGLYGRRGLPFIQQESTIWHRDLNETLDLQTLATYRLAGDHYMWHCFAQHYSLDVVDSLIGAFAVHEGQLSSDLDAYWAEVERHSSPVGVAASMRAFGEAATWRLPSPVTRRLGGSGHIRFDHSSGRWCRGATFGRGR
jgi:glycosyltransferase involved in cell wall biosynthesis